MSSTFKPVIAGLMLMMLLILTSSRIKMVTNRWAEDELSYALRVATQDATAVIVDKNYMMDGEASDGDFMIQLSDADDQFQKSFEKNIGSVVRPIYINSMNIPLSGYVGYRYIFGKLADGTETFPYSYTYTKNNRYIYGFTLGDQIDVTDTSTKTRSIIKLSELPEHFFSADITNKNFKTITIMQTINKFLSDFNSTEYSVMSVNAGTGLTFTLGGVDYTENDPKNLVEMASVIDGPGYFAVTDFYDPQLSGKVRTFTFGGSEWIYAN